MLNSLLPVFFAVDAAALRLVTMRALCYNAKRGERGISGRSSPSSALAKLSPLPASSSSKPQPLSGLN